MLINTLTMTYNSLELNYLNYLLVVILFPNNSVVLRRVYVFFANYYESVPRFNLKRIYCLLKILEYVYPYNPDNAECGVSADPIKTSIFFPFTRVRSQKKSANTKNQILPLYSITYALKLLQKCIDRRRILLCLNLNLKKPKFKKNFHF